MPRKCCVPGCVTNYNSQSTYKSTFLFPKDAARQKQWLASINRKDFAPGPSAVVCIEHFDERFIIREDKIPQKDGSELTIPRKKITLTENAYPTIFPNQPHYLTKVLPKPRKSPSKRREEIDERDENLFAEWCKADGIKTLNDIKITLQSKLLNTTWLNSIQDDSIFIYKIEVIDCPQVTVVLEICDNLTVKLFFKNEPLNSNILGFILGDSNMLDKWSKFDSVLSFLNSFKTSDLTEKQKVSNIALQLDEIAETESDDIDTTKLKFISHQLFLASSKKQKYIPEMILWALQLYFNYPAAYLLIRKSGVLTLPHQSYLRSLAGNINFSNETECTNKHFDYLKHKAKNIKEHEKTVNILLDEIYINPSMDYKGGNVVGIADNCDETVVAIRNIT